MDRNIIKAKFNNHQTCMRFMRFVYNAIKRPDYLQHNVHFGTINNEKPIYLIRPNTEDGVQGLMSLFVQTMRKIDYALSKGYIPFVDFQNYKTQYYDGNHNVWEDYFTQPSKLTLEEVYCSRNVILSGVSLWKNEDTSLYRGTIFHDETLLKRCHKLIWDNISYSMSVSAVVNKEMEQLLIEECIGVYIRGTDYIKLKPPGEYVQPTVEQMIQVMKEFAERYPRTSFFVVTEDGYIFKKIKDEFNDRIKIVSFDSFITEYDGQDFLSKSNVLNENKKARGLDYLVKIILLSKCKCLISSITMGSIAAYALNGNEYREKYIFDLGIY